MLDRLLQFGRRLKPAPADPYPGLQPGPWPGKALNDADAYGVRVQPANVLPGTWYWQAASVHHLTPQENGGRHHILMDLVESVMDGEGKWRLRREMGGRLKVTWEGSQEIVTVHKTPGEPGTDLPLWRGQLCSVSALGLPGAELPSDEVQGIHTGHPDEPPGNTLFHHSFNLIFQKVQAPSVPIVVPGDRALAHYVLFGPAERPNTLANLRLAQEYLLVFRPAFGFNPGEAAQAGLVTIVANRAAVPPEVEERLAAGGGRVIRIEGTSAEVARALAERVAHGER